MQNLGCVAGRADDSNNWEAGVQSQAPGVETEPGQGQYQVSRRGTRTVGRKQVRVTSQSQQMEVEEQAGLTSQVRIQMNMGSMLM